MELNKAQWREKMMAVRQGVARLQAYAAAKSVAESLSRVYADDELRIIAGYVAFRGEVDIIPALERLAELGHYVALPSVDRDSKQLIFKRWNPGEELQAGEYGIPHPKLEAKTLIPDLVLVPLLAFDDSGHRLGYGGGYYDRSLEALRARNPQVKAIGVGYALQEVERLPAEPHDARLDAVVTEKGIREFS